MSLPICRLSSKPTVSHVSELRHAPQTLTLVEHIEALVDLCKGQLMRDVLVDLQLTSHVEVRENGDLRPRLPATECCALPRAARDELEGPCGNLLTSCCYADDDGDTPTSCCALQRGSHHLRVARAVERVVYPETCHCNDFVLNIWLRTVKN